MLLDNFEHLLEAAPAVSALLSASGGFALLVTSRSPLHMSGEREYRLDPLLGERCRRALRRAGRERSAER